MEAEEQQSKEMIESQKEYAIRQICIITRIYSPSTESNEPTNQQITTCYQIW